MRGFTLLEVVVALAILGVSLTALLETQAASLNNAGRSRDLTVASLLARAKMIDIEQKQNHDGFTVNTEEDDGDFRNEGHPEITWKARVSPIQLDLSALSSLCGSLGGGGGSKSKAFGGASVEATDCENALGGIGATVGSFTEEIGQAMRVADLEVSWPDGRTKRTMSVRGLLVKDDYSTAVENALMQNALQNAQSNQPGGANKQGASPGTTR